MGYLDRNKVTKYLALEPNIRMHPHIRAAAKDGGFNEEDGSLVILSCGAEGVSSILEVLGETQPPVDTIVSILTLCSVPSPERTIRNLVRDVMKPGGQFLFYEHVLSPREMSLGGNEPGLHQENAESNGKRFRALPVLTVVSKRVEARGTVT